MAKKNKRNDGYLSIRKKLIAAIAMLLVASFMVASSSYAWFTLSTAPEIKGISTAVGANGSLEIALLSTGNNSEALAAIQSGVGDSGNYTTWGNLIDLSDSKFGLQSILLMPARLNYTEAGAFVPSAPLRTPIYGADGRIEKLDDGATTGSYHSKDGAFKTFDAASATGLVGNETIVYQNEYGVRVVGNSTTLTQQQIDYRNAQVAVALALNSVRTNASDALTAAGSGLAGVAIGKALGNTSFDISSVQALHDKMDVAVNQLDAAIVAFAKANYATVHASEEKATYESGRDAFIATGVGAMVSTTSNATLTNAWNLRNHIATALETSKTAYETANKTAADYNTAYNVLLPFVDLNSVEVNGYTINAVKENMSAIAQDAMSGKGVVVTLKPAANSTDANAGIYVNLAKLVGNFDVTITITGDVSYNGISLAGQKAKMKTAVSGAPTVNIVTALPAAPTAGNGQATSAPLNDVYGYMLDFAFRTNATGSKLMLQTNATDRIYSSGGSQATQGGGSTMSFSASADFDVAHVKELMKGIRIVFMDGENILKIAGLNTAASSVVGNTVTAPIQVYDDSTYVSNANGFRAQEGSTLAFVTPDAKGATDLGITLAQNQAKAVTVLVYLDGDYVTNAKVANAEYSMSGTMNLQFSSSAELKPMSYAPLQDPTAAALSKPIPSVMAQGSSTSLPATITVDGATKQVTWTTSAGATVEENTLTIDANASGTITLTATYDTNKTATYLIQVVAGAAAPSGGGEG